MEVSMVPGASYDLAGYSKTNIHGTEWTKKVGKLNRLGLVYQPLLKLREGLDLKETIFLTVGMTIIAANTIASHTVQIADFCRGMIVVNDDQVVDITEDKIVEEDKWTYTVQFGAVGHPQSYGLKLHSLSHVAVKRNPAKSAELGEMMNAQGQNLKRLYKQGRERIRQSGCGEVMDADSEEETVAKPTMKLPGEDKCWRFLNQLPYHSHISLWAEDPPIGFNCNICGECLAERRVTGRKRTETKTKEAKSKSTESKTKVFSLENCKLMNCIKVDRRNFIKEMGKPPTGYQTQAILKVLDEHCKKHAGNVVHHFIAPKINTSIWAWEMTVRYVAQVLMQEALFQVGLDKSVFEELVDNGNQGPAKGAVCAVLGCGIGSNSVDFQQKLIGNKYNGLYVPAGVDEGFSFSVTGLRARRKKAIDVVVQKAQDWISQRLSREMQQFDFTTLVTALGNAHTTKVKGNYAGYLWNAFGLLFRCGVLDNLDFPPATRSMGLEEELSFSVWDSFSQDYVNDGHL